MQALLCKDQELAKRVSIGTNSMRARLTLVASSRRVKKCSEQMGSQTNIRGHGCSSPATLLSDASASRINSGQFSKYHCVSANMAHDQDRCDRTSQETLGILVHPRAIPVHQSFGCECMTNSPAARGPSTVTLTPQSNLARQLVESAVQGWHQSN